MTEEQLQRSLTLLSAARAIKRRLDTYVLLKAQANEVINAGPPSFSPGEYSSQPVTIPESARRHVFHLWQQDQRAAYNAAVRELNQLGVQHGLTLDTTP